MELASFPFSPLSLSPYPHSRSGWQLAVCTGYLAAVGRPRPWVCEEAAVALPWIPAVDGGISWIRWRAVWRAGCVSTLRDNVVLQGQGVVSWQKICWCSSGSDWGWLLEHWKGLVGALAHQCFHRGKKHPAKGSQSGGFEFPNCRVPVCQRMWWAGETHICSSPPVLLPIVRVNVKQRGGCWQPGSPFACCTALVFPCLWKNSWQVGVAVFGSGLALKQQFIQLCQWE